MAVITQENHTQLLGPNAAPASGRLHAHPEKGPICGMQESRQPRCAFANIWIRG